MSRETNQHINSRRVANKELFKARERKTQGMHKMKNLLRIKRKDKRVKVELNEETEKLDRDKREEE